MSLFFYGTLRHLPLLSRVLGRDAGASVVPARLPGYLAHQVAGATWPMIVETPGAVAEGLFFENPSAEDLARLDFYEGGYGYAPRVVSVQTDAGPRSAQVYVPDGDDLTPAEPWDLAAWEAAEADLTLRAAAEVIERMGHNSAADVARLYPAIRGRAWAQMLAQRAAPSTLRRGPDPGAVQVTPRAEGFDGFFRLRVFDLTHRRFDGRQSAPLTREVFQAFDAALVLPYDPVTDQVLLIEQLRLGPLWRGDPAPWMLEPIAGLVDAGEAPADAARREAMEEAGLSLGDLRPMLRIYASPGYSTEYFHCYLGLCDLTAPRGAQTGLESEHEDIRAHILPFDAAMALVDSGEVATGPLAMMLLWLAREREALRASA